MKKTVTLDELRNLPELSEERLKEISDFTETDYDPDNPPLSKQELSEFRRMEEIHPDWYKPRKKLITIRLDIDVIEKYKSYGKGYQTKINADLRKILKLE